MRARSENGARAFERLLDATSAQTAVMTSMLEVQRAQGHAMVDAGQAVSALGGLIEKQTSVLEAMKKELEAGVPRTEAAVEEVKMHTTQAAKESDQRLYRWLILGFFVMVIANALGGGLGDVLKALMKLPH